MDVQALERQLGMIMEKEFKDAIENNKDVSISLGSMSMAGEVLERLGLYCLDDFDSNGWQADMWETYEDRDGRKFILNCGGYFGGVRLYPNDDYE